MVSRPASLAARALLEYVMTPGRPAASSPASRTRAAEAARSSRCASRAWSRTAASATSSETPSLARFRARRMEFSVGPVARGSRKSSSFEHTIALINWAGPRQWNASHPMPRAATRPLRATARGLWRCRENQTSAAVTSTADVPIAAGNSPWL
ncbi:hypothetical protein SVIOM74S_07588 [Streptomyces violarus]